MSTAKNAAIALRTINRDMERPKDWRLQRYLALEDLSNRLEEYAKGLAVRLDALYNHNVRQHHWYPVPFMHELLSAREAQGLQFERSDNANIPEWKGFKAMQAAAAEAETLFKLVVAPYGVSIVCDFLTESKGEVLLVLV